MSYYMAGEGSRLFGHTTPSELPDKFQMSVRPPIGVVGVITPWNFPIAIPSWKIVPALVCGNTVVFKPANDTPMLGQRFVELLVEAGVPAGVVNLVHGFGARGGGQDRPPSRCARRHAHRLARDRRRGARGRGREPQARPPRARRQERRSSSWTTRTSTSPWRASSGRPSARRASAARRRAASSSTARSTTSCVSRSSPAAERLQARPRVGGRHGRRAGHQRRRAREDPFVHGDREGRGRARC